MRIYKFTIAIYHFFQSGRQSSAGNNSGTFDLILGLAGKYVQLTLISLSSTIIAWILYIILPLLITNSSEEMSLYYSHFMILIMIDIFINSVCVLFMFNFAENYYLTCMKCQPMGYLCGIIVNWIKLTQFVKSIIYF